MCKAFLWRVLSPTVVFSLTVSLLLVSNHAGASDYFFHSSSSDFLDNTSPGATTPKFKDSTAINRTAYKEVGTWAATPMAAAMTLNTLSELHVWLGLKNSDDQGTYFDVRAEMRKQGVVIALGETKKIQGITRNASKAKEVMVAFGAISDNQFNSGDVLSIRILTKVADSGGHSSAVGLRLYYDAVSKASRFGATFSSPPPALQVRITSPAPNTVIARSSILVLGDVLGIAGAEIGVSVNGVPTLVSNGQFAARVAVSPNISTLAAIATDSTGATGTDSIPITVQAPVNELLFVTPSPRSGPAPLQISLRASFLGPAVNYQWDIDGNGNVDLSGSELIEVIQDYGTPGLYFPAVTVTDNQGRQFTEIAPLLVFSQGQVIALLQTKWQEFKDALRGGDVSGAIQFVTQNNRSEYQQIFQNLTVPTSNIDQVLTNIQFVQFRQGTAEFEMLRTDERGELSYLVRFVLDEDGIWRIKDM
jgi:hypothetical protein